ncbi:hypothetical protein PSACC_00233 [Paramicrosporidium saccamoebae]|uniref:Uncharacterized protein n=1 Tax=Paramicrosporidium saccamoebae TaxID=1246581 RepID=A0A2H9TQB7_9FUNG|nr:hypothetical protein PSACC_00233 [Paramicrosporidium saccamoebae]
MADEAVGRLCQILSLTDVPQLPEQLQHDDSWRTFLQSMAESINDRVQRTEELEKLSQESRLRQVNLEEQTELNRITSALEESSARISELGVGDKSLIQVDLEKSQSQIEMLRARCERLEAEKADMLRLVDRRQLDIDSLNQQIEDVTSRMRTVREEALKHDSEVSEMRSKATAAQRQLELVKEESDKHRQQAEWNSQELDQHIQEFSNYRKQKSAELASLQVQLERTQETNLQLDEQNRVLRTALEEKDSKVEELLRRTRDAESALAEQESMFVQEMNARSRLADLYKEGMEETTVRLEETEALLQISQSNGTDVDERIRQALQDKESEISLLQSQLHEKDKETALLRKHMDELGSGHVRSHSGADKTLSEVYAESAKAKTELLKAHQEIERLKGCIQDICQDIEARVPVLQMERRENERLKVDVSALSQQLLEVSKSRDELERKLCRVEEELRGGRKEKILLEQQVKDLGKQIQALLGQMEGIVPNDSGVLDSEQVIDERLVVFRNIQELQVRNQELVRVLRELSQQQETAEIERLRKVEQEMRGALDQNAAELAELKETRQRQSTLMESLIRQRDMLRDMLGQQRSPVEESAQDMHADGKEVSEMRAELEMFRTEKAESEKYLMEQLEHCRNEKGELSGRVAQLTAQLEFKQERYTLLKQNYDMERVELDGLRKSNNTALSSIMQHQSQVQQLMGEMLAAKDAQQRSATQLSSLRVELDMTRTSERRLTGELTTLQQEKERLSQLLSGLQAMSVEHEGSEVALKHRLNEQIEFLERELQSARHKVVEEVEAHKLAVAISDREYRDLVRRYDQLEETNQTKSANAELTREVSDLRVLHQKSEERLAQFMVPTGETDADLPRELAALRMKFGAVEDELRLEREHVSTYKMLAKNAEDGLNDLTRTFDEYKAASERRISELTGQADVLSVRLENTEERCRQLESKATNLTATFTAEKNQLVQQLAELKEYESMAKSHSSLRKEDVDRLQSLVSETQSKYEQEVVAHGRDLEALQTLKGEMGSYQQQISELSQNLNAARDQLGIYEKMLQSEREQWNAERVDTQRRVSELEGQNSILLGQIESMAGRASRRTSDIPTEGGDATDLMEVVRYLRRQKDILQIEHDSMSMEYRRVKAQAEQLQRSLDETRSVLAEERQGSQWQEQMASEYRALLEKVSQMNILRESNVTLRQEADSLSIQVRSLQAQLQNAHDAVVPKEEECRILNAKLVASGEELRVVRDDRDNWKRRFDQLLTKYRVDPAEMEQQNAQLTAQLAQMTTELEELKEQLEEATDDSDKVKQLEEQLVERNAIHEQVTNKLAQLDTKHRGLLQTSRQIQKTRDELAKRVAELESAAAPTVDNEQLVALQAEKDRLDAELAEKTTKLEKYVEAFKKLNKVKEQYKDSQTLIKNLQDQVQNSEQRLEEVKKEAELRNNLLNSNWQAKMRKLTEQLGQGETKQITPETQETPMKRAKVEAMAVEDLDDFLAETKQEEEKIDMNDSDERREQAGDQMGVQIDGPMGGQADEQSREQHFREQAHEQAGEQFREEEPHEDDHESVDPTAGPLELVAVSADPMLGFSDMEDEMMGGMTDEDTSNPVEEAPIVPTEEPVRKRVIDLSEIGKRPVMRHVPLPARGGHLQRGRGQPSLRRVRRGGPSTSGGTSNPSE